MKKGTSIQFKILALILLLIIVTTTLLAFLNFRVSSQTLEDDIKGSLTTVTANIEGSVNNLLKSYDTGIKALSENQALRNVLVDTMGRTEDISDILQDFAASHEDVLSLYLATINKELLIYPEADLPDDFDPTSRAWYQDAVKRKSTLWTSPYIDAATGKMIVTVARPVYDTSKRLVGVIGIDISLEQLASMISGFKVGEKGYFILTDTDGNVLVHPKAEMLGKPIDSEELLKASSSTKYTGTLDYTYNNEKKFCAYTTISRSKWRIFGTFSYTEILNKTSVILRNAVYTTLVLMVLAILAGIIMTRPIIKGIKKISKDMAVIGNGDFTIRSSSKARDEIGLLASTLNKMAEELSGLMANIKDFASEISASSDTLAATSEESTATTEEIARAIQEIVKVTEDQANNTEDGLKKTNHLAENIQGVSDKISIIVKNVTQADILNKKGIESLATLKEKSDATDEASDKVGSAISEVNKSIGEIGVIVDTIAGIASQTNLLSLNASIEAARAGESGRGFAVVADEIRKLAEQSAQASDNIRNLIGNIQGQSKNAVETMDGTKPVMEAQHNAVTETESVFAQISGIIEQLSEEASVIGQLSKNMVEKKNDILTSMESISAEAEQASASTQQISASTNEQLAATDEVAKTAEKLNNMAQKLSNEVSRFKI